MQFNEERFISAMKDEVFNPKPSETANNAESSNPNTGKPKYKINKKTNIGVPRINDIYNRAGHRNIIRSEPLAKARKKPKVSPNAIPINETDIGIGIPANKKGKLSHANSTSKKYLIMTPRNRI